MDVNIFSSGVAKLLDKSLAMNVAQKAEIYRLRADKQELVEAIDKHIGCDKKFVRLSCQECGYYYLCQVFRKHNAPQHS